MIKRIIFPIFFSLFALGLASCDETNTSSGEKCEHVWDEGTITKEATEEEKGSKTFTCNVCKETKVEEIDKLPHTHKFESEWTKNATHHWHEASCGHNDQISDKAEHAWDEGTVTKEPTEVSTGVKTFKCTVCEEERKETIDKLICTHSAQKEYSTDKTHHWFACSICNEPLAKEEHSGGTATCTEKATCEVCNEKYGDFAPHNISEEVFESNEQGHWHECSYNDCDQKTDIVGHVFDKEVVKEDYLVSEATCETAAIYYKSCICGVKSNDNKDVFYVGEALGHTGGTPTCEYGAICGVCGKEYGEKADHNYGELIPGVSCDETGLLPYYQCSVCEKFFNARKEEIEETDLIAKGKHNYGYIIDEVPATCEKEGMKAHYICSGCGKYFDSVKAETSKEDLIIEVLGHEMVEKSDETYVWQECDREGCDHSTPKELKEESE